MKNQYLSSMLRQLKTFIGVQALHLDVHIGLRPVKAGFLPVSLKCTTTEKRIISELVLVLKEEYSRGRWTRKHKETLHLGNRSLQGSWTVHPDLPVVIEIDIPFKLPSSPLEEMKKQVLLRPLAIGLGWIENTQSSYFLEITTSIQGAALPMVKKVALPGLAGF